MIDTITTRAATQYEIHHPQAHTARSRSDTSVKPTNQDDFNSTVRTNSTLIDQPAKIIFKINRA